MANPHVAAGRQLYGAALADAALVVVAAHGRGQSPDYLVDNLIAPLERADVTLPDIAWILPAAEGNRWYPQRFMDASLDDEPLVAYALATMAEIERELTAEATRRSLTRVVWAGFSQGACIVTEHVSRAPLSPDLSPPAGLICLTGGMIGPPEIALQVARPLMGMPAYFSNSENDEWVPLSRTEASVEAFRAAGADAELEVLPGREHLISATEIDSVARFLRRIVA